jgi:hypothetical protein
MRLFIPRLALTLYCMAVSSFSRAATWRVECDPQQPVDRVGRAVALASSGDTILIGPGTYYEHIPLDGKSLTFLGTSGAAATILDGGTPIEEREGSILYMTHGQLGGLSIGGLTFQNGQGCVVDERWSVVGGAVALDRLDEVTHASVQDCVFQDNRVGGDPMGPDGRGGAISFGFGYFLIERCVFARNTSGYNEGGAIYGYGFSRLEINDCRFEDLAREAGMGAAMSLNGDRLRLRRSIFTSSGWAEDSQNAIMANVENTELDGNVFDATNGVLATRMMFGWEGTGDEPPTTFLATNNVFIDHSGSGSPIRLNVGYVRCAIEAIGNTFDGSSVVFEAAGGTLNCTGNVFYRSPAWVWFPRFGGRISCNCVFGDSITVTDGNIPLEQTVYADPMFCNEAAGDLHIARQSPCAGDSSPPGCGRIGALEENCNLTPIERMTWGRIKARFRDATR